MKTTSIQLAQYEWLLNEIAARPAGRDSSTGQWHSPHIETAPGGDDAINRAADFEEKFPGRVPDGNCINAVNRIRTHLNRMVKAGMLVKRISPTYKDYIGDHGAWVNTFSIEDRLFNQLKNGEATPTQIVRRFFET